MMSQPPGHSPTVPVTGLPDKTAVAGYLSDLYRSDRVLILGATSGSGTTLLAQLAREILDTGWQPSPWTPAITQHGLPAASYRPADSLVLPYPAGYFDLVICDHISAYIDVSAQSLTEIGRTVQDKGFLLGVDYFVPGNRLRGKKARQLREAGQYINIWSKLRHPEHRRYLDQDTWEQHLSDSRWQLLFRATRQIAVDFDHWCASRPLSPPNRIRLRAMLLQAPEKVQACLTPLGAGDRMAFHLTEGFMLATKPADAL